MTKKFLKLFYHIWAWCPSWSCDLGHLIGKVVSETIFEKGERVDGRRLDGFTISSL